MNILGIHDGHDASACLICDGAIVADAAEERFSRIKHRNEFPIESAIYCLAAAGLSAQQLDVIAVVGKFLMPRSLRRFVLSDQQAWAVAERWPADDEWRLILTNDDYKLPLYFQRLELAPHCRFVFVEHHLAHPASAYFSCGSTEQCLIATIDAVGDDTSTALWRGEDHRISRLRSWGRSGSLGIFYGTVTGALGWQNGDGEGSTMGLAPYGEPCRVATRLDNFHPLFSAGELAIPHDFGRSVATSDRGNVHFHTPEAEQIRKIADEVGHEHVAARAQNILEQQVLGLVRHWLTKTRVRRLLCSGGVFLNVKLNQRIWYELDLDEQWIYPSPGDAGSAMGAALCAWRHIAPDSELKRLDQLYLGPQFSNSEIRKILDDRRLPYLELPDPARAGAKLLAAGKNVAWFQGRMESGPRALGNRSILMGAGKSQHKEILNSRVKFRETFRPFCPSMITEKKDEYLDRGRDEPFMITSFNVKPSKREKIPAVVHVDGTVRPQTVKREVNPVYHQLIMHFGMLTGEYVLLSTSFNIKGEPIICSPQEAIRCFYGSGIDALVLGDFLLSKHDTNASTGD
jgi:carbamoyltransferase